MFIHGFKRRNAALLCIFLIALTLRLVSAFLNTGKEESYWLGADAQYDLIASNIVSGRGYYIDGNNFEGLDRSFTGKEKIYSFRSPLYPYTLALLYKTFGRAPLTVGIFQALISSLIVLLFFLIGRKLFDERVGLGVALVVALYPYSIQHDIRVFDTALFEFILACLVLSILRMAEKPTILRSILIGFLMGLAIHCRTSFVTFTAFFFLPFLISYKFNPKQVFRITILIILTEMVVLSPWVLRNYFIHDKIVLSTYGGWNFLLGNNATALQKLQNHEEADLALSLNLKNSSTTPANLTETEMDKWFFQKGFEFIKNNPYTFFKLLWVKTINFWNVRLTPPSNSLWKELIYSISYGTILLLSIPGIFLSFKEWRKFFFLYLLFVYFTISFVPFITTSRHRKPLDPYLAMFGVYWIIYLYEKFQQRKMVKISHNNNS